MYLFHKRAGGIYDLYVVSLSKVVCLRRFAVGTEQNLRVLQFCHLFTVDGLESEVQQSLTFHAIMNYIAQAIQFVGIFQLFLRLRDGSCYTEAETAMFVNFYQHLCLFFVITYFRFWK